MFICISISTYAQTYLDAYHVTFYDGQGNYLESNQVTDITFKLSDTNLIMGGGITFWFYGDNYTNSTGTSTYARPDDGSGNCVIAFVKKGPHLMAISIAWSNLRAIYMCRY